MFFRNKNKNETRKIPYLKEVERVKNFHKTINEKSQEELITLAQSLREDEGENKDKEIQAYALIHEVIKRILHVSPYDVQIAGAIALREGNIAQMRTGEGKTITALFPAFWGYVFKQQTYVITVNEYLAERDYLQAKAVFDYLNISIGLILKDKHTLEKKAEYKKPVVYVTNTELAFDYLRDNITTQADFLMQGAFDFAIIDEADLVLIDEAKNPVVISGSAMDESNVILKAKYFIKSLVEGDFDIDDDHHIPLLTDQGFEHGKTYFNCEITDNTTLYNAIQQALYAHHRLKIDVDYIVRNGEILIVDKFTGRVLPGRRFQSGLHQAIEAKEGVNVNPENMTLATATYQSLFRKFKRVSGMTGTGIESKEEFKTIYHMDVEVIPTNKPNLREDKSDILFETKKDKYEYLVSLVKEKHEKGQPILIGTISVKESEEVEESLRHVGIPYRLLNAKNDKEEVSIVESAGERGAVTISTNMAGRGTDIKLNDEIEKLGGLCVIGVSRNESKRIDRQLRGRSGRQGQKGESIYLSSLQDDFLLMYPSSKLEKFIGKNIAYPVTKQNATTLVDEIQNVMESMSTSIRKMQFQMDDILHYQREYVYQMRKSVLQQGVSRDELEKRSIEAVDAILEPFIDQSSRPENWDLSSLKGVILSQLGIVGCLPENEDGLYDLKISDISLMIHRAIMENIDKIANAAGEEAFFRVISQQTILSLMDNYWISFLQEVELYKQGFGMSSIGEQDPIRKFSVDMDALFKALMKQALIKLFFDFNMYDSRITLDS
jgi:preprotein translocase subunit SecA